MVNKAVLLASTVDANNDGPIGKTGQWSGQPSDAEDGAGQINLANVKTILDANSYTWADLTDANFSSCGTGCRQYVVPMSGGGTSLSVPANQAVRVSLVWQSCITSEIGVSNLNNDLDLVLNCGSPLLSCHGSFVSNTIPSETEMVEKPACFQPVSCAIDIRIKNGAALSPCGTSATERIGVAWSFR
jgi:hypothetical protein